MQVSRHGIIAIAAEAEPYSVGVTTDDGTRFVREIEAAAQVPERGIMEFTYNYPGNYVFHAHKTEFSEKGWVGMFAVSDRGLGEYAG